LKLRILSDLHIEFGDFVPGAAPADVVVLAGDIFNEHHGLEWARRAFPETEIVYVLGNHEFYQADYELVLERAAQEARRLGIHLLERESVVLDGVRFLGTTLWTDFETAEEKQVHMPFSMWYAWQNMSDFSLIGYRCGQLTPEISRQFHLAARQWLKGKLAEPFQGETVVVTHHLPHRRSVHADFHKHPLNPAFVSHLPDLVRKPVALWVHGHTHCSVDYVTDGTRVVCNPRGYAPRELNPRFDPGLIVEV
jgi:predicted phosphodiesterase